MLHFRNVGDRHYENAGWGPTIRSRKHLRVKAEPQTLFLKAGRKHRESELIYEARAHLRSPFPGIGEPAGGEAAQCFDPLTSRGFTRVARGRYPIWGCSGLQQHTRLPTHSRACREQGYTIDSGEDYRGE